MFDVEKVIARGRPTQWRSQPDNLVMLCKFFCVYRLQKESISKEMNNDNDLNLHSMTKLSGWLRYWAYLYEALGFIGENVRTIVRCINILILPDLCINILILLAGGYNNPRTEGITIPVQCQISYGRGEQARHTVANNARKGTAFSILSISIG